MAEWFGEWWQGMYESYWKTRGKEAKNKFERLVLKVGIIVLPLLLCLIGLIPTYFDNKLERTIQANQRKHLEGVAAYSLQQKAELAAAKAREEANRPALEAKQREDEATRKAEAERREKEAAILAEQARLQAIENAQNDPTAKRLFTFRLKRATEGEAVFQYDLALQYLNGQGVPQDVSAAKEWLKKAATQGHKKAQAQLAELASTERPATK